MTDKEKKQMEDGWNQPDIVKEAKAAIGCLLIAIVAIALVVAAAALVKFIIWLI